MSFRLKTILGIALIEGMLLLLLIWIGVGLIYDSQQEVLELRAKTVATLFATATKDPVLSSDLASLESFTDEVMKNPGLVYARVLDRDGEVMVERTNLHSLKQPFKTDSSIPGEHVDDTFDAFAEIIEAGTVYGQVQIGLSISQLFKLVNKARSNAIALALLEMSLVAIFSFFLGTWLTRQIKALELGAQQVSSGEFGHQVQVKGNDEIARTTKAFNVMSLEVKQLYEKLSDANEELEKRIIEQTRELEFLFKLSSILVNLDTPLELVFNEIISASAEILPYSNEACIIIKYGNSRYQCSDIVRGAPSISSLISVNGEKKGYIEISCLGGAGECDTEKYLNDKKALLEAISQDVSTAIAHRLSMQERQKMEIELRHAQKLESVGQLAAGIAHEINTPTQFVNDNTHFLKDAYSDYSRLLTAYEKLAESVNNDPVFANHIDEIRLLKDELDIEYLTDEIPKAVDQSLEGLQRITKIVQAMKEFSHPGSDEKTLSDLNRLIETTVEVTHNEWKYVATLEIKPDLEMPQVPVLQGEFNQVMLNLIVNAAHAISAGSSEVNSLGEIRIEIRRQDNWAVIEISDNGCGMSDKIRQRIFDPFFTTKEVGQGSGQGLAIAWSIIVDKHGGIFEVESEPGIGSKFIIKLPVMISKEGSVKL